MNNKMLCLIPVDPQPQIVGLGTWLWPLPKGSYCDGCSEQVVTASREWWEYVPSFVKPTADSEAIYFHERWYWIIGE